MEEIYRQERLSEYIGQDLVEKYPKIEPLLDLIDYRMVDAADDYRYAYLRLFIYDSLHGKKAATIIIAGMISPVLWVISRAKHRKVPKAVKRAVFSNTFLLSARYPAARESIERENGCTAVLTFTDMLKLEGKNQQLNLKASLKPEKFKVKPIFFPGWSIIGGRLRKAVIAYCEEVYGPAGAKDKTAVENAIRVLEKAYFDRVKKVENCLRREDCLLYMTVNQFNLRDLLMVNACKNLGIRTLQQEHHASQFSWLPFSEEKKMDRLSLIGEYGFWNKTEKLFHEKVYRYVSPLYRREEIRFLVTGNPEISLEEAEQLRKQYKPERKLTYMMASHQDYELEGIRDQYEKWRSDIFKGLRELSNKQNIPICIRYTPNKELELRKQEEPMLKEWGFIISESVPGNLMEDLCTSTAILSSSSSVMSTARLFGKLVFRVKDFFYPYVHVDDDIHEVNVEDLPNIVIPAGIENTLPEIDYDGIFNIRKLEL